MAVSRQVDIVVAGAINTDLVAVVERAPEAGETVTGKSFSVFGGGKAGNQAVAARRAGAEVAMVGAVGDDAFGAERIRDLAEDGIVIDSVARIDGMASGVALIIVERAGENRIAYVPGPTLTITGDHIRASLRAHRPKVYLQPNEVVADAAAQALEATRALGVITIVNAAPDPEKVRPLLPDVDYLIVNEVEAFALVGGGGVLADVAETLARESGTTVVLTAGADGVYGVMNDELVHFPAPKVQVVDTTGAGDTFCGAFATSIARGVAFQEAVAWAVHAGSLATTLSGAQPSIPNRAAIDAFIAREV